MPTHGTVTGKILITAIAETSIRETLTSAAFIAGRAPEGPGSRSGAAPSLLEKCR